MNDVIQKIYDIGIVPVIAIDDADKAVPLAKALVKGGLPAAEVGEPIGRKIASTSSDSTSLRVCSTALAGVKASSRLMIFTLRP